MFLRKVHPCTRYWRIQQVKFSSTTGSTWSPLALAFNSGPSTKHDKNINTTGLFGWPELKHYEGFDPLRENCINRTLELIDEACSPKRSRKMVEVFDEMSNTLCKVADMAEFIRLAHPDQYYNKAAEQAHLGICSMVDKLNTHRELYNVLKNMSEKGDILPTTNLDDHVTKLFIFDFEQSGIHLEEKDRQLAVNLNDYILQLGQKFVAGTVAPRIINREHVPQSVHHLFSVSDDTINISGLYAESSNQLIREVGYKLFLLPDSTQEILLDSLLDARHELAKLCGFNSYCERAVKASIVETPEFVRSFLDVLNVDLKKRADDDFKTMEKMKSTEQNGDRPLRCWDTHYYTSKIKKESLGGDSTDFMPYFPLGACMEGFNMLMKNLYGIKLINVEAQPGELWSSDVYKLEVTHETEGLLGIIYCDFYERDTKSNQDCHYTIQGGKLLENGDYQIPIVVVMLNLNSPSWSKPTLLTPNMVDTLFHEMGHAMHSMLARTKYQHITGTRCSTDFAEVPSILMEYFSSDPRVLSLFARHYKTNEPMPNEMLNRMCMTKQLFAASETQMQLFYSALDHFYHSQKLEPGTTTSLLADIQGQYYGLPYVENTAWQLRFSHLIGYGARYYSYLISKAVASWIWQTYFAKQPLNRDAGERYRTECLAFGGGKPPRQMIADFLKRDVTPDNLAHSLITEIDEKQYNLKHISVR